jgi:crotonobetainyl-CoA:carnitine CoA-transferase CaiB-like acyl-CoA transferase
MKEGILQGLRVLDLTRVVAGPFATRTLADFGAEVIKIQTEKTATGAEANATGYFNAWNRNKKSVTLNLNHGEARGLFCRLVAISDIVVENFTPRVMANWGLTYKKLKEIKSDIIMLSMSGLGQTGLAKDFAAYGPTLQSLGGLTWLTSFSPEEPLGLGYSYADPIFGLYGAISILGALEHRDKTGEGGHIDLSGLEAVCSLIGTELLAAATNKREVLPTGNHSSDGEVSPSGCYPCKGRDRWCVIAVSQEEHWQALCRVTGHAEWSKDEWFFTPSQREKNRQELDALLTAWTRNMSAHEVVSLLQEAGVPAGVVQDTADLASDPQLAARDFFTTLAHPLLGRTTADTYPFSLPDCHPEEWQAAPLLGADNGYVFQELLGLGIEEISRLKGQGVIG